MHSITTSSLTKITKMVAYWKNRYTSLKVHCATTSATLRTTTSKLAALKAHIKEVEQVFVIPVGSAHSTFKLCKDYVVKVGCYGRYDDKKKKGFSDVVVRWGKNMKCSPNVKTSLNHSSPYGLKKVVRKCRTVTQTLTLPKGFKL
jgi:hypothetical protein